MTENEFIQSRDDAIRRMREMNNRTNNPQSKMPLSPDFVRYRGQNGANAINNRKTEAVNKPQEQPQKPEEKPLLPREKQSLGQGLGIPFLDKILTDGDSTLIIGLLLLLMSEKSDKILLFALVYILL